MNTINNKLKKKFDQLETINLRNNILTDVELDIDTVSLVKKYMHVTKIEVFPTDTEIPAGTVDTYEGLSSLFNWSGLEDSMVFTGLTYIASVPASNSIKLEFRTHEQQDASDIVIDWGDENIDVISDINNPNVSIQIDDSNNHRIRVEHIYSGSYLNRKNICSIYGKKFFYLTNKNNSNNTNIISRVFEPDLPVQPNLIAVNSLCQYNRRILRLEAKEYYVTNLVSMYQTFYRCENLQSINVYNRMFPTNIATYYSIFKECTNLKTSNMRIPNNWNANTSLEMFYSDCTSLSGDILDLLPINGFDSSYVRIDNMHTMFENTKLSCSDYDRLDAMMSKNKVYVSNNMVNLVPNLDILNDFSFNEPQSKYDKDNKLIEHYFISTNKYHNNQKETDIAKWLNGEETGDLTVNDYYVSTQTVDNVSYKLYKCVQNSNNTKILVDTGLLCAKANQQFQYLYNDTNYLYPCKFFIVYNANNTLKLGINYKDNTGSIFSTISTLDKSKISYICGGTKSVLKK